MNICVHSVGNVGSNIIFESIAKAGVKVFETHALRHDYAYLQQLQSTKPTVKHLQDSLKVKSLIKQKENIFFVIVMGDPIRRNLLQFFQTLKKLNPDFDAENAEVTELREHLAESDLTSEMQSWVDLEIQEFLGVDFDTLKKFEGGTLFGQTAYGPALFVKSDLTASQKTKALSKYLNKEIIVRNTQDKLSRRVQKIYQKTKKQGLRSEYVDETLNQPFVNFFYTQKELDNFRKIWIDTLSADEPSDPLLKSTRDHHWVCVHHMGNVGAEYILDEIDKSIDQVVFETKTLNDAVEHLNTINERNSNIRYVGDGLELLNYLAEDVPGKFVIVINNPIVRNLVTYIFNNRKALQDGDFDNVEKLVQDFEKANPAKGAQVWISKEILSFFNVHYADFEMVSPGVAYFKSKKAEVLIIGTEVSDSKISRTLSKFLHQKIDIDRTDKPFSVKLFDPRLEDIFLKVKDQGISQDYVESALGMRYLSKIFNSTQLTRMRIDWENSVTARRINKDIPSGKFGRELASWRNDLKSNERIYEAEGGFHHYGARTNIAAASYWAVEPSHPKDLRFNERFEEVRLKNYKAWRENKFDEIEPFKFSPKVDVLIHDISVEVDGIPIENYPFLLGDGCVYYGGAEIDGRDDRYLPGTSEAHCTALSLRTSSSFLRSLELPEEFPIFLSKYETLDTPQHFARHWPHKIQKQDLDVARVRTRIKYREFKKGMTAHKFIRIPYLDQYPFSPTMVQENRPWYHAWDKVEPLKVRGFAVYFSPKPPINQQLEQIKVHVLDKDGNPIEGKAISMLDQNAGGNTESFSLKPSFMKGDLTVEAGEFLSASAYLVDGTPAADLAFYILVEIPESKIENAYGSPLFYSQGCANLEYLQNSYDADRREFISTPAALAVLRNLSQTTLNPWKKKLGLDSFPSEEVAAEKMYTKASKYVFVD